jgi:1,4-dihydroxy-2-naphthoate octaprenyltransferase
VLLGEPLSRRVFALTVAGAYLAVAVIGIRHPWCLIALLSVPLAIPPVRQVLGGARGRALVVVLGATARVEIVYAVLLSFGLAAEVWFSTG